MNDVRKRPSILTILIISIVALMILSALLRVTNLLNPYKVATPNMEPAIKTGGVALTSKLLEYDYNSIVAYKANPLKMEGIPSEDGNDIFIGRIAAKGGDSLQLKNGRAYVNGEHIDKDLNLQFFYRIEEPCREAITNLLGEELENRIWGRGLTAAFLTDEEVSTLENKACISLADAPPINKKHAPFLANHPDGWTVLDYGPIYIPEGKYFIMGDNRQNSLDSRNRGFVDEEKIVSTMIQRNLPK